MNTNKRYHQAWLTVAFVALAACGDDGQNSNDPAVVRTLDSCETTIAADVPEFFRTYFRCVDIASAGADVVLNSVSLPPHPSYYYGVGHANFEDFDYSRGPMYGPNPNVLSELALHLQIPVDPTPKGLTIDAAMVDGMVGTSAEEYGLGPVGVALDSVALFNPLAAPGDDIEAEKYTFDSYNAHPTMNGAYHYHTNSPGPLEVLVASGLVSDPAPGAAEFEVFGVMCDGTVVMGCTELDGNAPDSGDFDAQNGHVHDLGNGDGTVLLSARYHTHICPDVYAYKFTPEIQYYEQCVR